MAQTVHSREGFAPPRRPVQGSRPGYFAVNGGGPTISIPPFSLADR
jgi:hypothetical protein